MMSLLSLDMPTQGGAFGSPPPAGVAEGRGWRGGGWRRSALRPPFAVDR
jgi:hypothetical protein